VGLVTFPPGTLVAAEAAPDTIATAAAARVTTARRNKRGERAIIAR